MTKIHLSEAQSIVLSGACARKDGAVFPVNASLIGGAVGNVCKSLLRHGLIEEITACDLNTVWRHDEERGPITLRATQLAYGCLGVTDDENARPRAEAPNDSVRCRIGTKQDLLIEMLRAEAGATIDEIVAAIGWQPHTVRGAISSALKKKLGLAITSETVEGRGRIYMIVGG